MNNLPIQRTESPNATLIAPSVSQELNAQLHHHFNIPPFGKSPETERELLLAVGGLLINYHALYLELSGTPLKAWIDEHFSGFYLYNANRPTVEAIEKISALIQTKGANNG